jgi:hypothetical protein
MLFDCFKKTTFTIEKLKFACLDLVIASSKERRSSEAYNLSAITKITVKRQLTLEGQSSIIHKGCLELPIPYWIHAECCA